LKKGEGHDRLAIHDEATFSYTISQGDLVLDKKEYKNLEIEKDGLPKTVMKLLKTMKADEEIECKIYLDEYISAEKPEKTKKCCE